MKTQGRGHSNTTTTWRRGKRRLQRVGEKRDIKSVLFIPHTRESKLAEALRERENKLFDITGDRVKVVERSGMKLEDILTNKDPWKGKDCQRENCFICSTKQLTEKNTNKDCTKRNITYEIRCLTCEAIEIGKVEEEAGDDYEKKEELMKNLQIPRYIGETSRSGYERGFEHLDMLTTLSSKSVMLRHMLSAHENKDMSEIKWGMFITGYKRSAFDRQVEEAVSIEREFKNNVNVLNSKSEWQNSALPKLVTKANSIEEEKRAIEKQFLEEKTKEEEFESKLRNLRKLRNKARLQSDKNPTKRQKLDNEQYISIRKTWGPPPPTAPKKNCHSLENLVEENNKKIKLDNISTDPTDGTDAPSPSLNGENYTTPAKLENIYYVSTAPTEGMGAPSPSLDGENYIAPTKLGNKYYVSTAPPDGKDAPSPSSDGVKYTTSTKLDGKHYDASTKVEGRNIVLTNIRTLEGRIIQGETIKEFEIIEVDWEKHLSEHKKRLEEETLEREKRLEKQAIKEKSWQLYRECKEYLEKNEKDWIKRKIERDNENIKLERLARAKEQQEQLRNKVRSRNLEKEIRNKLEILPNQERKLLEEEEKKRNKLELAETKKSLWKLRNKEKKYERKPPKLEQLEKIDKLEEKLRMIEKIIEDLREEELKFEAEKSKRKEEELEEWRKKVREKNKREKNKAEKLEKARLLSQRWAMHRWVSEFILENQEKWEEEKKRQEEKVREELENWNKMKRFEKIEKLKKKWTIKNQTETSKQQEEEIRKSINTEDTWSVWRKREKVEQEENTQEITTKNILENEITTIITKKVRINLPKITIKDKQDYVIPEQKLSSHQDEGQSSTTTSPKILKMTLRPPNKKDNPRNRKQTRNNEDDIKTTKTRKITSMFSKIQKTTSSEDDQGMKNNSSDTRIDMKLSTPVQKPVLKTKLIETNSTLSNSNNFFDKEPDLAVSENCKLPDNQLSVKSPGPNENSDEATLCISWSDESKNLRRKYTNITSKTFVKVLTKPDNKK